MRKPLPMAALLLACSAASTQEALPDPTRPPAGFQPAASAASSPAVSEGLVLQSVLIGRGRVPAAVISGQLVPLGGQVADMRLALVTERSVQLRGLQGLTTLHLMPEALKREQPARDAQRNPSPGVEPK